MEAKNVARPRASSRFKSRSSRVSKLRGGISKKQNVGKWTGVRDYITKTLCKRAPFNPPRFGKSGGPEKGQENGKFVDDTICQYVDTKNLPVELKKRKIVRFFLDEMNRVHLIPLCTQVTLVDPGTGIKCRTDVIAMHKKTRRRYVVEIKATLFKLCDYINAYELACKNKPYMENALPNTEKNRHILQVAAAMRSLSCNTMPITNGMVLIMAKDKSTTIPVDCKFINSKYWNVSINPIPMPLAEETFTECIKVFGENNVQYGPPSLTQMKAVMIRMNGQSYIAVYKKNTSTICKSILRVLKKLSLCLYASEKIITVCYPAWKMH